MKRPLGARLRRDRGAPGHEQAEHVAQIVAGIGQQRGRIAEIAVDGLGHDERGVERDADRERLAEIGGRMDMRVARPCMAVVVAMIMRVVVVHDRDGRDCPNLALPGIAESGAIVGVSPAPSRRNRTYSTGSTSSVSSVDERMPPMTTVASGRCTSAPAPVASAIGTKPSEATSAVISTGRRRARAPSRTASSTDRPSRAAADERHQHQAVEHGDAGQRDEADAGEIETECRAAAAPRRRRSARAARR